MFNLDQINKIHDDFGSANTLVQYLHSLNAIGVTKYDSFIADGHSEYFGAGGHTVVSSPVHDVLAIAATNNERKFHKSLQLHKAGKTSYLEMVQGLANSGIAKWTFDTAKLTLTYYTKAGDEMLVETIV